MNFRTHVKPINRDRNPENEVRKIAQKFPEMNGSACSFHLDLCRFNLLGTIVPMDRGIPISSGKLVKENDKSGLIHSITPEAKAFKRWSNQEFSDVERQYAKDWRLRLSQVDLEHVASTLRILGLDSTLCKNIKSAKLISQEIVEESDKLFERMKLVCYLLRIPEQYHAEVLKVWKSRGSPILAVYATVLELFFHIAISTSLISPDRPSNLTDIAYLNYLPFCDIFVSSDNLHKKCAPIFLREGQLFVWGPDLKKGLQELNVHYNLLSLEVKEKGIQSFASLPPKEGAFCVSNLWDKFFPNWRNKKEYFDLKDESLAKVISQAKRMTIAPSLPKEKIDFDTQNPDSLLIERAIHKKKGSWYQIPKNFVKKSDQN